jgi:type III secretion protein J
VPSRTAEHAKLVQGTAGELERSLRAVDGVLSARVHLAVPAKGPLGEEKPIDPTASVLVRHRGATPPITPGDVQRLVAGAVPGLDEKQVRIVLTPSPDPGRPPERELSRLGPVTVTRSSLLSLRAIVGAIALINVILVSVIVAFWAQLRRARGEIDSLRSASEAVRDAQ